MYTYMLQVWFRRYWESISLEHIWGVSNYIGTERDGGRYMAMFCHKEGRQAATYEDQCIHITKNNERTTLYKMPI